MIVGTIGYNVHSGLGHLVRSFYRHGIVQKILLVPHPRYPKYGNWYPAYATYDKVRSGEFLKDLDVLLLFENGWYWDVVEQAKAKGIRVVMIPNYEYTPNPPLVQPDLYLCGSLLDVDYYDKQPHQYLPMPVEVQWNLREKAIVFIHNAGHGQRGFAKGTPQLVEAMEYVRSPIKLIVRGQPGEKRVKELFLKNRNNSKLQLELGDFPDDAMYATGDVFINAEQYNGLSLPLQEARASGMLIITTNRYPTNTWLPIEPLIMPKEYVKDRVAPGYAEFDRAIVEPREIAKVMDEWYGRDITEYSKSGREYAKEHSWEVLKPKYLEALKG